MGFSVLAARKMEREPLTTQTTDRNTLSYEPRNQRWRSERAERTKLDFRCPIYPSAIGQVSCLICVRRRQLTFPFCW